MCSYLIPRYNFLVDADVAIPLIQLRFQIYLSLSVLYLSLFITCLIWFLVSIYLFILLSYIECREDEFACDSGFCINGDAVCNGINECGDNTDEFNCSMYWEIIVIN